MFIDIEFVYWLLFKFVKELDEFSANSDDDEKDKFLQLLERENISNMLSKLKFTNLFINKLSMSSEKKLVFSKIFDSKKKIKNIKRFYSLKWKS